MTKKLLLILMALVAISPVVILFDEVQFDPARFVEEWVKLWVQGTILLIAAWMVSKELNEITANRSSRNLIKVALRTDLEEAIKAADNSDYKTFANKSSTALGVLRKMEGLRHSRRWTVKLLKLRTALETERLQHLMRMESKLTDDEKGEIQCQVDEARREIEEFLTEL